MQKKLGVLVGMQLEANLARHFDPYAIEISGATCEGAQAAIDRLLLMQPDAIISFGVAAGLDPEIRAGTILLPNMVSMNGQDYIPDPELRLWLGAEKSQVKVGALFHSDRIIASVNEKQSLFNETGCIAVDMESGLVAGRCHEQQIPFAVLRVVCDSADRDLPSLVNMALSKNGTLNSLEMFRNLLMNPKQIRDLIGIGKDMAVAYWNLNRFMMGL